MRILAHRFASLIILASAFPLFHRPMLAGQEPFGSHLMQVRPFTSVDDVLNREAESADPAGIHQFSEDLIGLVVPKQAGNTYLNSITDRLAKADQIARHGKDKLVPEVEIALAFNNLMKKIDAPFRTDEATVRRFRQHSIAVPSLPALLTADRNAVYCSPAEAVYLLYLLLWANGDLPNSVLDDEANLKQWAARGKAPMRIMAVGTGLHDKTAGEEFTSYSTLHGQRATTKLFNGVARAFRF